MFIKQTSIKRKVRAAVLCILSLAFLKPFAESAKSQDKPAFDKPFKICRVYQNSLETLPITASDNNESLIFAKEDNYLISISPETNLENWRSQSGGKIHPTIISDVQSIYFLSSFEVESQEKTFILNSISQKTGITNWQKKLDGYTNLKLFDTADEQVLYLKTDNQDLIAVRKDNGSILWKNSIKFPVVSLEAIGNGELSILTEESLIRLSSRSGAVLSETKIKQGATSNSIKNNAYILLGYPNGEFIKIVSTGRNSGVIWKIKAGGGISSLIEIEDETLVSSLDNFLYLYSTESGKLKWKRRVSGRINIKPLIAENFAVVLSSSDNIASIIELGTGRVVNQINIEEGNYFSERPIILGKFIIFPTFRGVYLFVNSDRECVS